MKDVGIVKKRIAAAGLYCLLHQTSGFKVAPCMITESLFSFMEASDMLGQSMLRCVCLAAMSTAKVRIFTDITSKLNKLHLRDHHRKLSVDHTAMVLCVCNCAKLTWIPSVHMFAKIIQCRHMIFEGLWVCR